MVFDLISGNLHIQITHPMWSQLWGYITSHCNNAFTDEEVQRGKVNSRLFVDSSRATIMAQVIENDLLYVSAGRRDELLQPYYEISKIEVFTFLNLISRGVSPDDIHQNREVKIDDIVELYDFLVSCEGFSIC